MLCFININDENLIKFSFKSVYFKQSMSIDKFSLKPSAKG